MRYSGILHKYQVKTTDEAYKLMKRNDFVYIAGEVRTGKTLVAINAAYNYAREIMKVKRPLIHFITKKKAMSSIDSDFQSCDLELDYNIFSMDSIHKVDEEPDVVIFDEAHSFGSFPKPNLRARTAKLKYENVAAIFLSGTPSPESFSQLFHQLWITGVGPWFNYPKLRSFYRWAKKYVNIEQEYVGAGRPLNNYSNAKPSVMKEFKPYCVFMTQKDAGFKGKIIEIIHEVKLPKKCLTLLTELKKKRVTVGGFLVADTGAKLMSYVHQLSSGTYISEEKRIVVSDFKAEFIKDKFRKKKIAIFYVYVAEGELLKKAFPNWTDNPEVFKASKNRVFISQIVSGREGVNLASADDLIFFNISYSAVSYWQGRARSQSREAGNKRVNWIFSDLGIEREIYNKVIDKQDYTLDHFKIWRNSKQLLKRE
jgi:hypothetical protein